MDYRRYTTIFDHVIKASKLPAMGFLDRITHHSRLKNIMQSILHDQLNDYRYKLTCSTQHSEKRYENNLRHNPDHYYRNMLQAQ